MWWKKLFFTGLYTGHFPMAPGTAGTFLALLIYYFEYIIFGESGRVVNLVVVLIMIYPSIKLGDAGEEYYRKEDPPQVVLDEMMGYWISVLFYPFSWKIAIIAFVLFRIADILKLYPANRFQEIKGGVGIMMDDYVAGIYTNIALIAIIYFSGLAGIHFF